MARAIEVRTDGVCAEIDRLVRHDRPLEEYLIDLGDLDARTFSTESMDPSLRALLANNVLANAKQLFEIGRRSLPRNMDDLFL